LHEHATSIVADRARRLARALEFVDTGGERDGVSSGLV